MKKIVLGILILLAMLIVTVAILLIPVKIPREMEEGAFKIRMHIPMELQYFIVNDDGSEERVVLTGNTPEYKLSNGYLITTDQLPLLGVHGKIDDTRIAIDGYAGEELRILEVEDWFVLKPSRCLILFNYLPRKKGDATAWYELWYEFIEK